LFAFHMKETIFEACSCSRHHANKWYGRAIVPASTHTQTKGKVIWK